MANGIWQLSDNFNPPNILTSTRSANGRILTNSDCNKAYMNAPNFYASYSGTLIDEELFCVENDEAAAQVCEVRVVNIVLIVVFQLHKKFIIIFQGDHGSPIVTGFDTSDVTLVGLIVGNQHNCIRDPR